MLLKISEIQYILYDNQYENEDEKKNGKDFVKNNTALCKLRIEKLNETFFRFVLLKSTENRNLSKQKKKQKKSNFQFIERLLFIGGQSGASSFGE